MDKTTLYLIRHGKTEGSDDRKYKGHIDVPLSEEGLKQARQLGQFFKSAGIQVSGIYSSDLTRALETAETIKKVLGIEEVFIEPKLRERNFGKWEGLTFEEITKKWPQDFQSWRKDPVRFHPPDGESTLEVKQRVMAALNEIIRKHAGGSVLVVAHGGVNRVALCEFMGIDLRNIFRIEQDFCCINVIDIY
ncbi:MAG: alpha-ribazole phosphatase, partial [Nitrospirae bacterium]